jgi:hypothetical protein
MNLTFRRARADRSPRHEIRDVLQRDHVQKLAARRQPELVYIEEKPASPLQATIDVEAAIQVGVVDQALPAHCRARLLEVHAHDNLESVPQSFALVHQPARIFHCRIHVVNGAGTDHYREAIILAVEDSMQVLATLRHSRAVISSGLTHQSVVRSPTVVIALVGLISGWRLLIAFLFGDRSIARGVWRGWWYSATAVAIAAVASLMASLVVYRTTETDLVANFILESGLRVLASGVLFVPTYLHLAAEVWWRRV